MSNRRNVSAAACPWCGSQVGVVPWAFAHRPTCPQYQHQPEADEVTT